jgi:ABC-type transport system involved in cytochrome c biogenesis permease component
MFTLIMNYLTIAGMLLFVLFPVLLPAVITAVHAITDRLANLPRRTASHRFAVPAAA